GGDRAGGAGAPVPPLWLIHASGSDCCGSCGSGLGRRNRLAPDHDALRSSGANPAFAGRGTESGRGNRHGRWPGDGADPHRRPASTRGTGTLPLGPFRPGRIVPKTRQSRRGPFVVRESTSAGTTGTGAPVSGGAASHAGINNPRR